MQGLWTSDHTLFFESSRAYDGVGNVATVWSRVPQGTDTQAFCDDEQDRLTWAGSAGTPPSGCTSGTAPASTLPGGGYFQGYSYDNLDRLNLGDLGVYAYGSSGHVHAPTSITYGSAAYTATYDLAGNMVCRAPTNATTCAGPTPTGAQLRYDAEERLASWLNAPSSPTTTASYLYDGAGERVAQQVTSGGTTTTTAYLGGNEEVATTGSGTTTTTYYAVAGRLIALAVNGTFSYLANDGLGSVSVAFDASGNATASAVYRPYGTPRYTSGTMPGSYGFTGQHSDAAVTGLDYDHARYYDPAAGVFTTADNLALTAKGVSQGQAGELLNRYAYVGEDPETRTDPSGHKRCDTPDGTCGNDHSDHCRGQVQQCEEIVRLFRDHDIQVYLLLLATTDIGSKFLTYILYMARVFPHFIAWGNLGSNGPGAESTDGGMIILNSNTSGDAKFWAAEIVHEAVESYFDIAWGLRQMGAVHADYVAEWYAGEFAAELGDPNQSTRAYGLPYQDWLNNTPSGSYFWRNLHAADPSQRAPETVDLNRIMLPGVAWGQDGVHVFVPSLYFSNIPDPMGLEPWMLDSNILPLS